MSALAVVTYRVLKATFSTFGFVEAVQNNGQCLILYFWFAPSLCLAGVSLAPISVAIVALRQVICEKSSGLCSCQNARLFGSFLEAGEGIRKCFACCHLGE